MGIHRIHDSHIQRLATDLGRDGEAYIPTSAPGFTGPQLTAEDIHNLGMALGKPSSLVVLGMPGMVKLCVVDDAD